MRKFLVALILLLPPCSLADELNKSPATFAEKWIPTGWKVVQSTHGGLARKNTDDIALILEQNDPGNWKKNSKNLGEMNLNLNPRKLLVFIRDDQGYEKAVDIDRFIPSKNSEDAPCLLDPLSDDGILISKDILIITMHYFTTCGGWGASVKAWKFRYEKKRFRLIGIDEFEHMRNTGDETKYSANFLTGKTKTSQTYSDLPEKTSVTWGNISGPREIYLDQLSPAYCKSNRDFMELCP
jgi:hypothetical protein